MQVNELELALAINSQSATAIARPDGKLGPFTLDGIPQLPRPQINQDRLYATTSLVPAQSVLGISYAATFPPKVRLFFAVSLNLTHRNSHMITSFVVALTDARRSKGHPVSKPITKAKRMVVTSIDKMN